LEVKDSGGGLAGLANDACGIVFALVECHWVMNNGQGISDCIQRHTQGVAG